MMILPSILFYTRKRLKMIKGSKEAEAAASVNCTTFITVDEHGAILPERIAASVIGDNSTVNICGTLVGACCLLRGIIELGWQEVH